MLRKHYFNFNKGEVDYARSYVEDDTGLIKTINESNNLKVAKPMSFTSEPLFFDNNGANLREVNKSEDITLDEFEIDKSCKVATNKIYKCLSEIKNGYRATISKSDTSLLTDKELFSFVMNNSSYEYEDEVKDRFNEVSEKFNII